MSENKTLCRYLDRVFKLSLPNKLKNHIRDRFLNLKSTDELRTLCVNVRNYLISTYGTNPYFEIV